MVINIKSQNHSQYFFFWIKQIAVTKTHSMAFSYDRGKGFATCILGNSFWDFSGIEIKILRIIMVYPECTEYICTLYAFLWENVWHEPRVWPAKLMFNI